MNPLWIGLIFLAVLIVPNVIAFLWANGARNNDSKFWTGLQSSMRRPYKKEDDSLDELHRRVEEIAKKK